MSTELTPLHDPESSVATVRRAPSEDQSWIATVEVELPSKLGQGDRPPLYDELQETLEDRDPVFRFAPDSISLKFGVSGGDVTSALNDATGAIGSVLKVIDPTSEFLVSVSVAPDRDGTGTFVGLNEVSALMGVSKQRVYQLAKRPDFPEPAFRLKATPVWKRADIWSFERGRARA
jgi:predicted DNA-binding transcriptional regulator AlpA